MSCPLSQVLIRWAVQRGTSALPKSTHPERIAANLAGTLSLQLSDEEMQVLSSLQPQRRMLAGTMWLHKAGPYRWACVTHLWRTKWQAPLVVHVKSILRHSCARCAGTHQLSAGVQVHGLDQAKPDAVGMRQSIVGKHLWACTWSVNSLMQSKMHRG